MIRYECSLCGAISPPVIPDLSTITLRDWLPAQHGWVCYHTDSNGDKYACDDCSVGVWK
jgi:DNA-directed RNA polymerase subunit RPC12/RpoP